VNCLVMIVAPPFDLSDLPATSTRQVRYAPCPTECQKRICQGKNGNCGGWGGSDNEGVARGKGAFALQLRCSRELVCGFGNENASKLAATRRDRYTGERRGRDFGRGGVGLRQGAEDVAAFDQLFIGGGVTDAEMGVLFAEDVAGDDQDVVLDGTGDKFTGG